MNTVEVHRHLRTLGEHEQQAFLKSIGMPDQEIPDFLFNFNQPRSSMGIHAKPRKAADDPNWQRLMERMEQMRQRLAQRPPESNQRGDGLTPFELDVLHNRHLLNGSTYLDGASFQNPALMDTQVVQFLRERYTGVVLRMCMLTGAQGSGKTWGALAYLNAQADFEIRHFKVQRTNARYVTAYQVAEWLADYKTNANLLAELRKVPWLLLDDLGAEPVGFRGADFIAFIDDLVSVRHKYNRLHTIITSNASAAEIPVIYGERLWSRFKDIGMGFETTDPDFRKAGA